MCPVQLNVSYRAAKDHLQNGLELERTRFAELFLTEDAKEGVQAFIEKDSQTLNILKGGNRYDERSTIFCQ